MKKIVPAFIKILPLCVVFLVVVEIILTNQVAGSGRVVHSVDIAIDSIRQENDELMERIASASSLMTISAKASTLGLRETEKSQYLTIAPPGDLLVAYNGSN
jgi:hypothetical protein